MERPRNRSNGLLGFTRYPSWIQEYFQPRRWITKNQIRDLIHLPRILPDFELASRRRSTYVGETKFWNSIKRRRDAWKVKINPWRANERRCLPTCKNSRVLLIRLIFEGRGLIAPRWQFLSSSLRNISCNWEILYRVNRVWDSTAKV